MATIEEIGENANEFCQEFIENYSNLTTSSANFTIDFCQQLLDDFANFNDSIDSIDSNNADTSSNENLSDFIVPISLFASIIGMPCIAFCCCITCSTCYVFYLEIKSCVSSIKSYFSSNNPATDSNDEED